MLNGAKETALDAFIAGRIPFLTMAEIVEAVMVNSETFADHALVSVLQADSMARTMAMQLIQGA